MLIMHTTITTKFDVDLELIQYPHATDKVCISPSLVYSVWCAGFGSALEREKAADTRRNP